MDLAESIRENTAAVQELTAALKAFSLPAAAPAKAKPTAEAPAPVAPAPAPAAEPMTYDRDVKPLGVKLAGINRNSLVEILESFGVKKGTELTAEQFEPFLAKVTARIATLEAAAA